MRLRDEGVQRLFLLPQQKELHLVLERLVLVGQVAEQAEDFARLNLLAVLSTRHEVSAMHDNTASVAGEPRRRVLML